MRQRDKQAPESAKKTIRDIRTTIRHFSAAKHNSSPRERAISYKRLFFRSESKAHQGRRYAALDVVDLPNGKEQKLAFPTERYVGGDGLSPRGCYSASIRSHFVGH